VSKTTFDDATRRELRLALRSTGTSVNRASQAVDIACHAAEQSVETLFGVCKSAPDTAMTLMALEISLQLARARMQAILERTHALGQADGLPQARAEVGTRL
jgi:hypothetical protein